MPIVEGKRIGITFEFDASANSRRSAQIDTTLTKNVFRCSGAGVGCRPAALDAAGIPNNHAKIRRLKATEDFAAIWRSGAALR